MKNSFRFTSIVVIFILGFYACQQEKNYDGYFKINGTIKNAEDQNVFLKLKEGNELIFVDSATINQDGKFELKGLTGKEKFYIMHLKEDEQITLLIDSAEKITLTANADKLYQSYKITGSKGSELICQAEQQLLKTKSIIDSLGKIYNQNFEKDNLAEIKKELDSVFNIAYNTQKQYSINFIENNKKSLSSLIVISQYLAPRSPVFDQQKDFKYYAMVDSSLSIKYPNNEHVKKINKIVNKLKQAREKNIPPPGTIGVGSKAPEIILPNHRGDTIKLSDFKGKYVLVDFWASWSNKSTEANKNLNKFYWKYYRKFEIFQVSLDVDADAWKNAIKQQKLLWHNTSELKNWQSKPVIDYNVTAIPTNFMLDPEGKIIAKDLIGEELETKLIEIFKK